MIRIFLFTAFCFLSFNLLAQYGGTASVRIENAEGTEEYINVVYSAHSQFGDERSKVESNLEQQIKSKIGYNGKMKSSISFNVFEIGGKASRTGRASVRVINEEGSTRYINVSYNSAYNINKNDLADKLLNDLNYEMDSRERFYGTIQYTLN